MTAGHGRVVRGAFAPHPLLRNAHLQTLVPLLRPTPGLALEVERLELPDGDFVDLGWCGNSRGQGPLPQGPLPRAPLAILLHGLTGGFDSKYLRGTARQLLARRWRVVILQLRGAGPVPNRLPRHYHHGDTADLRTLIRVLREREPATKLFGVGWSLGASVLLNTLAQEGDACGLTAAVAACPPFQLQPCAERLRTGFARLYQARLLRELQAMIRRKHAATPLPLDWDKVNGSSDFFDFDNAATAVLNGFRDCHDYYARASSGNHLHGIRRPVTIIHARDDAFMTPAIVPPESALPPGVTLELCEYGGHVGFVAAGPGFGIRWWLEERIPELLAGYAA
jgi:hypothetical protein